MLALLLSLAQAAAPSPPPGSVAAPAAILRPHAVPIMRTDWLSREDFASDQADAASPVFTARLDVDAAGAVDTCTITRTSGVNGFDTRACEVLKKRARFRPALDATGMPMPSGYTYRLPWAAVSQPTAINPGAWISGDDYPSAALRAETQGRTAVMAVVEANGRVSDCAVTSSSGDQLLDAATCRVVTRRGRYRPALDATGEPVGGTAPFVANWRLPDE